MLKATRTFTVDGGEVVKREITRIAEDHPWATEYAGSWAPADDGPGDGLREIFRSLGPDGTVESRTDEFGSDADRARALDAARERVRALSENPAAVEAGTPPPREVRRDTNPNADAREAGLRAVDSMRHELSPAAGDRLDKLIRSDRAGADSHYIAAVSDADYLAAFGRRLADPEGAAHSYTPKEAAAVRRVAEAQGEQRALGVSTGPTGGFAVPATLDPSIMLTSDGRVNPIRELATTTQITTDEWNGVTSAGVSASWYAEAEEVSDDSPTLAQPVIRPERLSIFVPLSIEVASDWSMVQTELAKLFADARDELEGRAFATGTGIGEPSGLLTGSTVTVSGGTGSSSQAANYYSLQEALPPRWQPRATFLSSNAQQNWGYRSVAEADTSEPKFIDSARSTILGRPWRECSHMLGGTVAGTAVAYGDIASAYRVIDRIGSVVEVIPHLFGTANNRPTGQRGIFFYARTGGSVVAAEAMRLLVTS